MDLFAAALSHDATEVLLMVAVFPLWVAAGLVDWACHRRTGIEHTSGLPENIFHWVMLAQMGVAVLAVGLLQVNAAVLLLVLGAFLAHEFTTWLELRYTVPLRTVGPFEQMVHSFMELLPLVTLALLSLLAWDQVLALFGAGEPDFRLRLKEQPWPRGYLLGGLAAAVLFNLLPMAQETVRCLRARQSRAGHAAPVVPAQAGIQGVKDSRRGGNRHGSAGSPPPRG